MPENIGKTITTTVVATAVAISLAAWAIWPKKPPIQPAVSAESLVAQAKFNGADLAIQSAYTACPSRYRKYMIAFRGRVHYFIDTKSIPLTISEEPKDSGKWIVNAPAITLDTGFTSDIDSNGKSWRKAWVLDGSIFKNDTAQAANELNLLDNHALHVAYRRLTETDEIKQLFSEQVSQFVAGVLTGTGKKVTEVTVNFAATPALALPPVSIKFCKDDNGVSVTP